MLAILLSVKPRNMYEIDHRAKYAIALVDAGSDNSIGGAVPECYSR